MDIAERRAPGRTWEIRPRGGATRCSPWCSCSCSRVDTWSTNGWSYPRGVDRYEHAVMAGMMMREGSNESFMLYPPGFHLLTAMISRPSAASGRWRSSRSLLPCSLRWPLRAREAPWGWEYGVAAALTSGLLLGGTYLHFEEARYPNFIGSAWP